ncbi:MAG: polymer-forming cytoskeletal protein [Lachnospiraceae bacterium]|jgi:cytoskeletal protein CcmA (bactofilin family)|nr:polymer-forming cytoskeletal protein [Lachnospiraceae bacterium]
MRKKETQISTIIGMGAQSNGDFTAEGAVRIDGTINGDVTVTEMVIVGASGCINGSINTRKVVVGGEVYGNLNVPEKVELTSTARVIGDITTGGLVIDEKAVFQGRCDMNQDAAKKPKLNNKAVKAMKKSAKSAIVEALKEVEDSSEESTSGENNEQTESAD